MGDERRFDEQEIAEILEQAAASEAAVGSGAAGGSLTLSQLQEIGSEVGISPSRIADAARAVTGRDSTVPTSTFLGAPRSVSRVVSIDRALDDDEWIRLLVDLRETFNAPGTVETHGSLRSWTNGNLQVHVEPDSDSHRVRMQTLNGNVVPFMAMSGAFIVMAFIFLLALLSEGFEPVIIGFATMFGVGGAGLIGYTRVMLSNWADERAAQMEGLAERVQLRLEDTD